jgi:hypothetical protein
MPTYVGYAFHQEELVVLREAVSHLEAQYRDMAGQANKGGDKHKAILALIAKLSK